MSSLSRGKKGRSFCDKNALGEEERSSPCGMHLRVTRFVGKRRRKNASKSVLRKRRRRQMRRRSIVVLL